MRHGSAGSELHGIASEPQGHEHVLRLARTGRRLERVGAEGRRASGDEGRAFAKLGSVERKYRNGLTPRYCLTHALLPTGAK